MARVLSNEKYNGYTNYETWNICLWIQNDEMLYNMAKKVNSYKSFLIHLNWYFYGDETPSMLEIQTPDEVLWNDKRINVAEVEACVWGEE